jgi:hypothetical protein
LAAGCRRQASRAIEDTVLAYLVDELRQCRKIADNAALQFHDDERSALGAEHGVQVNRHFVLLICVV